MTKFRFLHARFFLTLLVIAITNIQAMSMNYDHTIEGHVMDNISGDGYPQKLY